MTALVHPAKLTNQMSPRVVDCFVVTVDGKPVAALNAQGRTVLSGGRDALTYEAAGVDNLGGWDAAEIAEDFEGLTLPPLAKFMVRA